MRPNRITVSMLIGFAIAFTPLQRSSARSPVQTGNDTSAALTIIAGGDVMAHAEQLRKTYNASTGTYNFQYGLAPIRDLISGADLSFANLETVLAGPAARYSGYPQFNTPSEMAAALRWTGFKVVTTANNHCMDRGKPGVLKTIQALDQAGLIHTGTFASQADRDHPTIVTAKGFRIGVIAYTFSTNGLPVSDSYLVNKIDTVQIARDAAAARAAGAEVVIACVHWGVEYQRQPSQTQRKQAREIIAGGVDIILGSHPHVVEPIEVVTTGAGQAQRRGLVFYSMGNLISNQRADHKDEGILVRIELSRTPSNAVQINHYSYIPTYVDNTGSSGARVYAVDYALRTEANNSALISKLKMARANTVGLLGQVRQ